VRLEKTYDCDTAPFNLTAILRDHSDTAGRLTKSSHCHIPIITVCKLHIYTFHFTTAHYRQPYVSHVWRLANAVPYPSMDYLYLRIPRCMTLSISSLFSVSYPNGLIYIYIYLFILNSYFRHNLTV
jgi:hypothetical protein